MSLVERLAEKHWSDWADVAFDLEGVGERNARWWLNAIADELDVQEFSLVLDNQWDAARWLRAQAKEE